MNVVFSVLNPSVKLWPHVPEHPVQTWNKSFKNASSYMENIKMRGTSGQFVRDRIYGNKLEEKNKMFFLTFCFQNIQMKIYCIRVHLIISGLHL